MIANGACIWNVRKYVKKGDYLYAVVPEHPRAIKYGYVLAHRVVMENHLGRLLTQNEVVHHINNNKHDNRIENLQLLTSSQHVSYHGKQRGREIYVLRCPVCNKIFERQRRNYHYKLTCCSRRCRGVYYREVQLNRVTDTMKSAVSVNLVRIYRKYIHDNAEETV